MGTIGAVLTTQMQEQTIFVSEDGERFDNKEDCLEWERLRPIINATADIGFGEREEAQDVFWWRLDIPTISTVLVGAAPIVILKDTRKDRETS